MAFKGFVIVRQEGGSGAVGGPSVAEPQTLGLVKVVGPKLKSAEAGARWSGTPEDAKVVMVETTGTAAEARLAVSAMFPGFAATACASVTEATFLES